MNDLSPIATNPLKKNKKVILFGKANHISNPCWFEFGKHPSHIVSHSPHCPLIMADSVNNVLTICGITAAAGRTAIIQEGFTTVAHFARVKSNDIDSMVKNLRSTRIGNQASIRIGAIPTKNMKALAWWARDKKRRGMNIMGDDFDEQALEEAVVSMELEEAEDETKVEAPGLLKSADDWISLELTLTNYLRSIRGTSGVPLAYIIRKDVDDIEEADHQGNDIEQLIRQAPHHGANYKVDNNQVYRIIKSKVIGTDILKWINPFDKNQDGRGAMEQLRHHYDGPGQIQRKISQAEAQIASLHYKSEQAFNFERFITKLNGAFQVLEENGEALSERKKVSIMCEKIQNNHTGLRAAVQTVRRDPNLNKNFKDAADSLSEHIASIFPNPTEKPTYKCKIAGLESGRGGGRGNGGRFNNQGGRHGRGGRGGYQGGRGGRFPNRPNRTTGADSSMCNGVDLRDIDRNFTPDEWRKLPNFVRDSIRETRAQKKARRDDAQLRGVSAASVQNSEDISAITPSQQTEITQNTAGRSFGRNAYTNTGRNNSNNPSTSRNTSSGDSS